MLQADAVYFMALPVYVMVGYDNVIFGGPTPNIGSNAGVTEEDL